jgi:hypothetical protein
VTEENDLEGQFAGRSDDPPVISTTSATRYAITVDVPLSLIAEGNDLFDLEEAAIYRFMKFVDSYEDEFGVQVGISEVQDA